MKKRLFAGALALLMIIGLLPVGSMLKKPVEAKADQTEQGSSYKHVLDFNAVNSLYKKEDNGTLTKLSSTPGSAGIKIQADGDTFYSIISHKNTALQTLKSELTWSDKYKASKGLFLPAARKNDSNGFYPTIKFSTSKNVLIKVWMTSTSYTSYSVGVYQPKRTSGYNTITESSVTTENVNDAAYVEISVENDSMNDYYIGCNQKNVVINKIEVQEYDYTININDGDTKSKKYAVEGETVKLTAADSSNFRYWVNSEGIMVSREAEVNIPVYYNDTYTAVYKDNGAVVNYLTKYGQVLYTYTEADYIALEKEPAGPVRYGYAFKGWSNGLNDKAVKDALAAGKSYDITPDYDSTESYEITINTEALGGVSDTKSYGVNEVVTATVSSDDFAYWEENGKIVSYSPTYLFFASKKTTVTAVKKTTVEIGDANKAVITNVYTGIVDGSPVAVFEYNIPADYYMEFAGVLASKTLSGDSLTVENGAYVIGDSNLSYTTYRYTVTISGDNTWYIKPMLKYTYNGNTYIKYGEEVIKLN